MFRPCPVRRVLIARPAGLVAGLALAAVPAPALAASGGAVAPATRTPAAPAPGVENSGGAVAIPRLRTVAFSVSAASVPMGRSLRFTWRVDGPVRRVTARVDLTPETGGRPVHIALGTRPTGTRSVRRWTASRGRVAMGRYEARLRVSGPSGALLRRTALASTRLGLEVTAAPAPAPVPAPPPAPTGRGVFPVQGAYDFGGPEDRFGAPRSGHSHQGQDILAALGTPLVSPVAGLVHWKAYQAAGAGYYLVIDGDDGRDYVFMHLQGPALVEKGQRVTAGQRVGLVGATGDAQGPHLHFEIWPDGWYAGAASHPIDPLPQLLAWAGRA